MADSPKLTSPVWVLLTGCSSSRTAPAWVLYMGCGASGTDCSSLGPLWGHRSCQKTYSCVDSSPQATAAARSLFWCGLFMGCSSLQGIFICCSAGSSTGCRLDTCYTVVLHGLQGNNLHQHGLHHKLQQHPCSNTWSTSFPSSFTDCGVCRVVALTYSHSFLAAAVAQQFLYLLKYVITEALPTSLISSALASSGSILKPAATVFG